MYSVHALLLAAKIMPALEKITFVSMIKTMFQTFISYKVTSKNTLGSSEVSAITIDAIQVGAAMNAVQKPRNKINI